MKSKESFDLQRALKAPADEFDRPEEVLAMQELDETDKKRILDQWETDARALARAGDEGMAGGEPSLLDEVRRAKRALQGTR